jgi:hypothetical protein
MAHALKLLKAGSSRLGLQGLAEALMGPVHAIKFMDLVLNSTRKFQWRGFTVH